MKRPATIIGIILLITGIIFSAANYNRSSEANARKVCDLASIGMKYENFEKLISENGIPPKPGDLQKNGETKYLFMFYTLTFSGNSCTIYAKDGLIIKTELLLDLEL
jgi:hypothetical protein